MAMVNDSYTGFESGGLDGFVGFVHPQHLPGDVSVGVTAAAARTGTKGFQATISNLRLYPWTVKFQVCSGHAVDVASCVACRTRPPLNLLHHTAHW